MITYTALATALAANDAAVAAAAGGGSVTAAVVQGLAELLLIMAQDKDKGQPPLVRTKGAKLVLNNS